MYQDVSFIFELNLVLALQWYSFNCDESSLFWCSVHKIKVLI